MIIKSLNIFGLLKRMNCLNYELGAHKGLHLEIKWTTLENIVAPPLILNCIFLVNFKIRSKASISLKRVDVGIKCQRLPFFKLSPTLDI